MSRHFQLLIATLGAATSAAAQAARLDTAKIDAIFAFAAGRQSPGCAVATIRDGKIEFARGYGMADIAHGTPITQKTVFSLASVTKQFTAAAINLLIADGRLALDDDVRKYVPELPRYETPITIRHLLNHTSGLRDYTTLRDLGDASPDGIKAAEVLALLARQRTLNFRPGEQVAYTNSGYVVLSIIVERASGKSLAAFADERLFKPLGMIATVFAAPRDLKDRAIGYLQENGKWRPFNQTFGVVGDGGLYSTVEDLAKWQHQMEAPRLGGAKWRELTEARGTLTDGTPLAYGNGLGYSVFNGEAVVQHGGGAYEGTAFLMRVPRLRLSVAVLCNSTAPSPYAGTLAERVAALYVPAPAAKVAPAVRLTAREMASYGGVFFNKDMPLIREIVVDGGKLFSVQGQGERSELVPLGDSRFHLVVSGLTARFSGLDTLTIPASPGSAGATFVRGSSARRDLRDYAGTYVSSELPARWKVQVADTGLTLIRQQRSAFRLDRAFEDGFRGPAYAMIARFIRDPKGEVTAMEINAGNRVLHLRFERQR